ncbi:aldose epimerase family protein [Clostridium polynesiense]|uniref:aldose epimerase family protein n=1 Tax=Clostridium polynesiense TaxID=1325933 RepID=UPI00058D8859|nr:aldose epimerase family protein [Clostridium polynesiense]
MKIEKALFGLTEKNEKVFIFTITNNKGNVVKILNYGCIIQSILIKDKNNKLTDVVMGFDTIEDYDSAGGFIGALVGRCANRINDSRFELNNQEYKLFANEGKNHLHGGKEGFNKKVFDYVILEDGLLLKYISPDGEENYPGELELEVIYRWTDNNELLSEYKTISDKDTVVNLTNHSYFNLNGLDNVDSFSQELQINSKYITPLGSNGLLTGEIIKTENTVFDFSKLTKIENLFDEEELQIKYANGYDHNFVLDGEEVSAILYGDNSGIEMKLSTDAVGLQFYSGNYIREHIGKYGIKYGKRMGICLEPQYFPNSINFTHFKKPIHLKGKRYNMKINYSFNIKN